MIKRLFKKLRVIGTITRNDQSGASTLELGLMFTPLFMFLIGIFDLGHMYYGKAVLVGAVNDASRASTMESNNQDQSAVDAMVLSRVQAVNPSATATFQRRSYKNFSSIGNPEKFTDGNTNGTCDNGEPFEDQNANGSWDSDAGTGGQGGASDAVIYTATVNFPRFFPLNAFIGGNDYVVMSAQTVLRNQPFTNQKQPQQGTCS